MQTNGIVYRLSDDGSVPWTKTVIHKFTGPPDGSVPVGVLVMAPSGDFWHDLRGRDNNMGSVFN
jgi:hypothetical protein